MSARPAATETAQQLKKTAGVPFHAKGRGLVKKIDTTSEYKINKYASIQVSVSISDPRAFVCTTAPLKGIPKAPFRNPTTPSMFSPPSNRTPIAPARTPLRKERGVKVTSDVDSAPAGWKGLRSKCSHCFPFFVLQLLDISELDMVGGGREAKRRRKTLGKDVSGPFASAGSIGLKVLVVYMMFFFFSSLLLQKQRPERKQPKKKPWWKTPHQTTPPASSPHRFLTPLRL